MAAATPTGLDFEARFLDPDAAYRSIIEAHRGLSEADSAALNAALVLILANQVGDHQILKEALELAKRTLEPKTAANSS